MKSTVFTDSSSSDDTDTEEAVGIKDDKKSKYSKSKSTAAKKRRNRKRQKCLRRKNMRSIKASIPEKEQQWIIYDTGTDCEVVGKGWHIYHKWNGKSIKLDGALAGM